MLYFVWRSHQLKSNGQQTGQAESDQSSPVSITWAIFPLFFACLGLLCFLPTPKYDALASFYIFLSSPHSLPEFVGQKWWEWKGEGESEEEGTSDWVNDMLRLRQGPERNGPCDGKCLFKTFNIVIIRIVKKRKSEKRCWTSGGEKDKNVRALCFTLWIILEWKKSFVKTRI